MTHKFKLQVVAIFRKFLLNIGLTGNHEKSLVAFSRFMLGS